MFNILSMSILVVQELNGLQPWAGVVVEDPPNLSGVGQKDSVQSKSTKRQLRR